MAKKEIKNVASQRNRTIYNIGGVRIQMVTPDIDGDGIIGEVEDLPRTNVQEVIPVRKKSDTVAATENLNKDSIDSSRLSTMDFLSRIDPSEYEAMTRIDALIGLKFLPTSVSLINRSKMRKSVSLGGLGRKEFVELVTGQHEKDVRLRDKFNNFVGARNEK